MRTTLPKIVKNSAKVLTAEVSTNIFSVFYFIIITWVFTKVELASLSILGIVTGLGVMFSGLGINPTLVKEIPKLITQNDRKTASAMFKSTVFIHFVLAVIVTLGIFRFSRQISLIFFKTQKYSNLVTIISTNIVIYKLLEDGEQLLTALQKFGKYSLLRISEGIFVRILALIGYFIGGIKIYIGTILVCQFGLFCLIMFLSHDLLRIKSGFYPIRKLVIYSLPFYGNAYGNFAAQQGDQFVIGVFLRPEQLAAYYVARRFFDYLCMIIDAILRPVGVKFAELKARGIGKVEEAIYKASRYLFFIVVPLSCFVAASSYPLLEIYGGKRYLSALPVLIILSIAIIPSAIYSLTVSGVYIVGEPKETFKSEFVRGTINFCLCLFFIGLFGITGISIAKFFSFLGACFFTYYLLKRLCKAKLDWGAFRKILSSSFIACGFVTLLQIIYYDNLIFPFYLLFGLIIFILLSRNNLVAEDMNLIQSLLPRRYEVINFIVGKSKVRR